MNGNESQISGLFATDRNAIHVIDSVPVFRRNGSSDQLVAMEAIGQIADLARKMSWLQIQIPNGSGFCDIKKNLTPLCLHAFSVATVIETCVPVIDAMDCGTSVPLLLCGGAAFGWHRDAL